MALAGFTSTLKIAGSSVSMTGEACSLVSGSTYRITNTAKRVIDPTVAVTVRDGGVAVNSANYAINFLHGLIVFSVAPSGAVTIDGAYLPLLSFSEVKDVSLSVSGNLADSTTLDSAGFRAKTLTTKDWSGSITTLQSAFFDNDPGAGSRVIATLHANGTPVLFEFGLSTYLFRGWALVESYEEKASVEGLLELSLSLTGTAIGSASFGWNP